MTPDVEWIETEAENIPAHGTFASPREVLESVFAKVPEYFEQELGALVTAWGRPGGQTGAGA